MDKIKFGLPCWLWASRINVCIQIAISVVRVITLPVTFWSSRDRVGHRVGVWMILRVTVVIQREALPEKQRQLEKDQKIASWLLEDERVALLAQQREQKRSGNVQWERSHVRTTFSQSKPATSKYLFLLEDDVRRNDKTDDTILQQTWRLKFSPRQGTYSASPRDRLDRAARRWIDHGCALTHVISEFISMCLPIACLLPQWLKWTEEKKGWMMVDGVHLLPPD